MRCLGGRGALRLRTCLGGGHSNRGILGHDWRE
jgi:hypothetical protein